MLLSDNVQDASLLFLCKRVGLHPLPGAGRGRYVAVVHVQRVGKRAVDQEPQLLASDLAL